MALTNCPNCGSKLEAQIEVEHLAGEDGEGDTTVKPAGGIFVCSGCNMAVDPNPPTDDEEPEAAKPAPAPAAPEKPAPVPAAPAAAAA